MDKDTYLKIAISSPTVCLSKDWYIKAFAIPIWKDTDYTDSGEHDLVVMKDGLHTLVYKEGDKELSLVKIEDHKVDSPLYDFQDKVKVDSSWLTSIKKPIETKIGILIVNRVVLYENVKDKIEYFNKESMGPGDIEKVIVPRVKNEKDLKPGDVTVKELVEVIGSIDFFYFLSTFISIGATPKNITAPPGAEKFRDDLLKEYEGRLDDPVVLANIQSRIDEFEKAYLADDPSSKALLGGKARASRTKSHYFGGAGLDFVEGGDTVVSRPLKHGVDTSPNEISKYMNDSRYASFSRGSETAKGGYSYTVLQRAISDIIIDTKPCNTKKGIIRTMSEKELPGLIGRRIKVKGEWVLIEDIAQTKGLADKAIEIRSPMFCTTKENSICYACISETYKDNPQGTTNMAASVSEIFITSNLKLMHNSSLSTSIIDKEDLIT